MSKIALQGNLSGTGTFTIKAPDSNNNYDLTLPSSTGTVVIADATGGLTVPSLNGGQLAGFRNKIINGKMEIAQRGTSFAAIGNGVYFNDRFFWGNSTAAVVTAGQGVGPGSPFINSGFVQVTTADSSIAAGDLARIIHRIEGFNIRDLFGTTFTLTFRVASAKTGTHCVCFTNIAGDRSYVAEYTVNAANTWETKTLTVSGGLITAGTWNTTTGSGLEITWTIAAGSTYQTTAGAWQTGYFAATSNQVNVLDTVGNIFAITGVQLEVGEVATPFEHRHYGAELALCQRYYEVVSLRRITGVTYTPNGDTRSRISYAVPKRTASHTFTQSGSTSVIACGASGEVINVSLGTLSFGDNSLYGCGITNMTNFSAFTACGSVMTWGDNGAGAATLNVDAEL